MPGRRRCSSRRTPRQTRGLSAIPATADTRDEGEGHYAYMKNTNLRGFWDDVERALHLDHPSRLSPWPIVGVSGNPR